MAAIDIHMFLESLKQLMSSGLDFVASQRDELQILYEYINEMNMLLKLTEESSTDMAMHIRDLVFEAENVIDLFVVDYFSSGGDRDCDLSIKLDSVKGEMEAIMKICKDFKFQFELEWWYSKAADSTTHVVGLRPHIDKIMRRFKHVKSLEIISIMGLPGTGKTTLAKQIYNDHCTEEKFEIQVWIKVCQGYRKRDFLASMVESLDPAFEGRDIDEETLGGQLLEHLQNHKYLIVMDDLWSAQALFDLQTYLPDNCNGSKIIVTTREAMVAKEIKDQGYFESYAIRLDLLSEEDSWELFRRNPVGHQTTLSKELKEFGRLVVKQCHGLPLAIAAISGVLALQSETPRFWQSTANTLAIFQKLYMQNLVCGYNQLPPHLKECLLYIGSFPQDYGILVHDLVWLLIAEGFVTDEVVAEGYISDLVDRGLVVVLEKRICGAAETCCIVSLMREFCNAKAEESKFAYQACSSNAIPNEPWRFFISGQAYTRISFEDSMWSLRSLLCLGDGGTYQTNKVRIFSGNDFKFLKVLNLLSVQIIYPFEIGVMVHLTYLAVKWEIEVVPESITNLINLETLIFSKSRVIYLPRGILKMDKLRRVCNKDGLLCFSRSDIISNLSGIAGNLQTVYPLCDCQICRWMLTKYPRIRMLGLSQRSAMFYTIPDNLSLLEDLETLECIYPFNFDYPSMYQGWGNNFQLKLPSSVKRLTLRCTFLEWEMISILGTLPNLEVLELLMNACATGNSGRSGSGGGGGRESRWDTSEQEFPRLKCLNMQDLDITEWVGNDIQFKSLEVLSIAYCYKLRMLPSGLARAPRLRTLKVIVPNSYTRNFFDSIVKASKTLTDIQL